MSRTAAALCAFVFLAAACGRGDSDADRVVSTPTAQPSPDAVTEEELAPPAETPAPTPRPRGTARIAQPTPEATPPPEGLAQASVRLTRIATLTQPLAMATRRGDDALYVAERVGRIRVIRNEQLQPGAYLDISGEVTTSGQEQGFLGITFSPDGGFLYVNFTDSDGDTVVREYVIRGGMPDRASARTVLTVDQPASNHNGGHLLFGPDGYLYIGLGDGGGAGDPWDNAQSLEALLGKMLRINPRASGSQAYQIPRDNPFVGREGRDEIWAYGLRNPWRYSFDRSTGDLYIGDVGQNSWEEIDFQPASSRGGENYGWNRMEGSHSYRGSPPPGHVPPMYEYARSGGNRAVIGGYVYRGSRIPDLQGAYVFADRAAAELRAFIPDEGRAVDHRFLGVSAPSVSSFGEDRAGELYVLDLQGGVFRIDPA